MQYLALFGFGGLIVLFLLSFFFRTAWGHWHKGRGREYKKFEGKDRSHADDWRNV